MHIFTHFPVILEAVRYIQTNFKSLRPEKKRKMIIIPPWYRYQPQNNGNRYQIPVKVKKNMHMMSMHCISPLKKVVFKCKMKLYYKKITSVYLFYFTYLVFFNLDKLLNPPEP